MKNILLALSVLLTALTAAAGYPLEGAWYGTNYTLPFAHAYRATEALGVDHKEAIDRDVYHLSRLGLNAFRLHLWDVELTDSAGNLLANDHLDLLDYLIASLEARGIDIVLTAQTNFGNGYPERNTDPNGAYTYRFPKCEVHENPEAQAAQTRYLELLAEHVNPYTGLSYASDPKIVGMEINNEPCHSGTPLEVETYIRKMISVLRRAGWKKPIFYNVSHNPDVTEAYFRAPIDGATYQWYPLGLVSGHTREGNFLPYVDSYDIPFDTIPGFDAPAKVIYEFDPADNLAGYLFPAIARTLRGKGFRWITQFAYDPIDIARFNSEYQTHYLNLAYTPSKALAMMIAAEVVRNTPEGADYGKYPVDTVFGPFTVSARRNLAMMRTPDTYIYSNTTTDGPAGPTDSLRRIAGVGSSPVVSYAGTGAYFLDRLDPTTWRLEVMPDATVVSDPFAKPSLTKEVVVIDTIPHPITISLPGLGKSYEAIPVAYGNASATKAEDGTFIASPGVYLLSSTPRADQRYPAKATYADGHRLIGEYVMPPITPTAPTVIHTPRALAYAGDSLLIEATTAGPVKALTIYPADVSFWREDNHLYPMTETAPGRWAAEIPSWPGAREASYYIVATNEDGTTTTWPNQYPATPLDWDYAPAADSRYTVALTTAGSPVPLLTPSADMDGSLLATIPGVWEGISYTFLPSAPIDADALVISAAPLAAADRLAISKYVGKTMRSLTREDASDARIALRLGPSEGIDSVEVSVVNDDGFTYALTLPVPAEGGIVEAPLAEMALVPTLLNPEPYPVFLQRQFIPDPTTATPLTLTNIDDLRIVADKKADRALRLPILGVWLTTNPSSK